VTHQDLLSLMSYEPETGVFTWLERKKGRRQGKPAGGLNGNGYRSIQIGADRYMAHRLAWFYVYGYWPTGYIDHINGDPADNRIANLREVTQSVNLQNQRQPRADNKTGFLGVSPQAGKYQARITFAGKHQYLGLFDTPEEAYAAYLAAKRQHHPGNCL
jgi:hypothetical protein